MLRMENMKMNMNDLSAELDFDELYPLEKPELAPLVGRKIKMSNIEFNSDFELNRPNGLGSIKFGTFKGIPVKVRKIKLEDVSEYVLKEVPSQINKFKGVLGNNVELVFCAIIRPNGLILVQESNPNMINFSEFMKGKG